MRTRSDRLRIGANRLEQQLRTLRRPDRLRIAFMTAGVLALTLIAVIVATASGDPKGDPVPLSDERLAGLISAATSCPALTAARLAGQVMATTGFVPTAESGVAGLSAQDWDRWKPWDVAPAGDEPASLLALAHLTCHLVGQLRVSGLSGDLWPLAVAAIASSLDEVRTASAVPTRVAELVARARAYAVDYTNQLSAQRTPNPLPQGPSDPRATRTTADPSTADPSTTGPSTGPASPTPSTTTASAPVPTAQTQPGSNAFSIAINPTSTSAVQGATATVTVTTAVTAGSAQSVTLAAFGLPAGTVASFNPATVTAGGASTMTLQTAATTPSGASTVTVTGRGSMSTDATVSFTVTPANTCTSPGQKLGNPGFESGSSPWSASRSVIDDYTSRSPHSGDRFAWLAGYGDNSTTTLSQTVALPAGCTRYTFTYWLHIDTDESGNTKYDKLTVQVLSSSGSVLTTLANYSNVDSASGYRQKSFDLASYAGRTIQIKFTATEDYSRQTSFIVDDTAMDVS